VAQRKKTPWVWLVVAGLLLAAGAWLMRGAEPPAREPPPPVRLPTRMTGNERTRAEERRVWVPPPMDGGDGTPQRPRDPVLAIMPSEVKRGAVVAEFNAIMNSELGGLMADCFFGDGPFMNDLRDAGLDPVQKVDRVAMVDDSLVVTGDFKNAGWKKFLPPNAVSKGYGSKGELIEVTRPDGGLDSYAAWGGQMFIAGGNEADQKAILDRLEGGGPPQGPPVLDDSMAYGEVYGVVAASAAAELLGQEDPRLAEILRQSAKDLQLHMDVSHDVGLVADVKGEDPQKAEELRRSIGSALSLARMQAAAQGKKDEADLLDLARVESAEGGSNFRLAAGVPHDFMKKGLEQCVAERKARLERQRDAGSR
jgi:hypothetical protein